MADKLKPEFVSPGEAWMNHVEKHHNASAVTPSYLKPQEKGSAVRAIEKRMAELEKQMGNDGKEKEPVKTKEKEINISK